MKTIKNTILISMIFSVVALISCDDDKDPEPVIPQIAILGKWEIIEIGNYPDMLSTEANGYTEFLSDSTIRYFDYNLMQFEKSHKYWVADSVLYESNIRSDGYEIIFKHQIQFFDNKIRLDWLDDVLPIFRTSIMKKIE